MRVVVVAVWANAVTRPCCCTDRYSCRYPLSCGARVRSAHCGAPGSMWPTDEPDEAE